MNRVIANPVATMRRDLGAVNVYDDLDRLDRLDR
jgi:hypothetical protein